MRVIKETYFYDREPIVTEIFEGGLVDCTMLFLGFVNQTLDERGRSRMDIKVFDNRCMSCDLPCGDCEEAIVLRMVE
jgi:hypothetical protein